MRRGNLNLAGLAAIAALGMVGTAVATQTPPPRRRHLLVTGDPDAFAKSEELAKWNAEVDAKRREKLARKAGRG